MKRILFLSFILSVASIVSAQNIQPSASFIYRDGEEIKDVELTYDAPEATEEMSAPVSAVFRANSVDYEGFNVSYVWRVDDVQIANPIDSLVRTFNTSGQHTVSIQAAFYTKDSTEPYVETDAYIFTFTISASALKFPNAFSPNGDGINDILRAKVSEKDKYVSIIEFHAAVFNRWGAKLYSWDDLDGGWDGKYNGKTVKDGVYFLVVSAQGADGQEFNIKKAINVLTSYTETE